MRYTSETLAKELGPQFDVVDWRYEAHRTPGGAVQQFCFCRFARK